MVNERPEKCSNALVDASKFDYWPSTIELYLYADRREEEKKSSLVSKERRMMLWDKKRERECVCVCV